MKPPISGIDKERLDWSLSWHPEGRCDSFTKETILLFAPPVSGVYGLFNRDCQVLIGEAENIREALLRHESETDFRSAHLRPTGFTFESCAAELRKSKVADLVARFHPVLQVEAALTERSSPSNNSVGEEAAVTEALPVSELKTYPDHEFPAHENERRSKARRHFDFKRARIATLFVACGVVSVYLGMPADYTFHKRANGANTISDSKAQSAPENPAVKSAGITPAKSTVAISASDSSVGVASKRGPASNRPVVQAHADPAAPSANPRTNRTWSVQVSATPSKEIADMLVQQLKSKGYAVYVVQVEVKGQSYHRVRVGPFSAREEAEPVRESLARNENFRDAYLAAD